MSWTACSRTASTKLSQRCAHCAHYAASLASDSRLDSECLRRTLRPSNPAPATSFSDRFRASLRGGLVQVSGEVEHLNKASESFAASLLVEAVASSQGRYGLRDDTQDTVRSRLRQAALDQEVSSKEE